MNNPNIYSKSIYIGTLGFEDFECKTTNNECFYPVDINGTFDRLKYYSKHLNSVVIGNLEGLPDNMWKITAEYMINSVNDNFKFVVCAPKTLYSVPLKDIEALWNVFWERCSFLRDAGVLGCVVVRFGTGFIVNNKNLNRLKHMEKIMRISSNLSFSFMHSSWRESKEVLDLFKEKKNWTVTVPFIENGFVNAGWAGNMPSTRTSSDIHIDKHKLTSDFIHISLFGSIGPLLGSYDENRFLERLSAKMLNLKGAKNIYVTFLNGNSSFCFPFPTQIIGGIPWNVRMKEGESDKPCCLHDALKLTNMVKNHQKSPYKIGEDGYVKVRVHMQG